MDTTMNRRSLLVGLAAASGAAVPVAVEAATNATPQERIAAAFAEIKAAASELWPDIYYWKEYVGEVSQHEALPILLACWNKAEPKYEKWTGPGRYEVQHGEARPIYYIERTGPNRYRACHWWKGKQQGRAKRFTDATLKIVRRMPEAQS